MTTNKPKTIIIGAGPGGASAAIYLARYCHDVMLIDASHKIHGRTAMAGHVENFLGLVEPAPGQAILDNVAKQLQNFGITPVAEKVTKVSKENDSTFTVTTEEGNEHRADYVIVAVGVGDNMPKIDGLDPYYDHAIFHCLTCDWYWNRDKKAAVIANDDRGIETALMINGLHKAPLLTVIPAETPRFSPELVIKAKANGIAVFESPLKELHGENGDLREVVLEDGTAVEAEVLFTKLGHKRYDKFLDEGGVVVEREPNGGFIKVDWQTFESSVSNLFAVGPCNEGPDQAIIAAGQGAMAALEVHRRIVNKF